MDRIDEIRARERAATPGPWVVGANYWVHEEEADGQCWACKWKAREVLPHTVIEREGKRYHVHYGINPNWWNQISSATTYGEITAYDIDTTGGVLSTKEDAEFIAAAREAVPYLLAAVDALTAELAELKTEYLVIRDERDSLLAAYDTATAERDAEAKANGHALDKIGELQSERDHARSLYEDALTDKQATEFQLHNAEAKEARYAELERAAREYQRAGAALANVGWGAPLYDGQLHANAHGEHLRAIEAVLLAARNLDKEVEA
jgi:hypothetical protein